RRGRSPEIGRGRARHPASHRAPYERRQPARLSRGGARLGRAAADPLSRLARPAEARALMRDVSSAGLIRAEHGDGYAALKAHLPPAERRGLVIIDPPYE